MARAVRGKPIPAAAAVNLQGAAFAPAVALVVGEVGDWDVGPGQRAELGDQPRVVVDRAWEPARKLGELLAGEPLSHRPTSGGAYCPREVRNVSIIGYIRPKGHPAAEETTHERAS